MRIGGWTADRLSGELSGPDGVRSVEPKVMDLLFLLASRPGEVFSKEEIGRAIWPDVTVGEDSLSRCVFKLRKALDDDPKAPRFIETIPKRGYRLRSPETRAAASRPNPWIAVALVAGVLVLAAAALLLNPPPARQPDAAKVEAMLARADDFYFQINRADNEAAIELYERALAERPGHPRAQAGMANALVQRVLRWSGPPGPADAKPTNLGRAIALGVTRTPEARQRLARARALAESAVRASPQDPGGWKALGFVKSAQEDFDGAIVAHRRAVALNPEAWDALVNLADLHGLRGDREASLRYVEQAYAAMSRVYAREPARIRPWYAETGVVIGREHERAGRLDMAELWYRRVLGYAPLHPGATAGLARMLAGGGDRAAAERLCSELTARTGPDLECAALLTRR